MLARSFSRFGGFAPLRLRFAGREELPHSPCRYALALLCSLAILTPCQAHPGTPPRALPGAILFGTIFDTLADPGAVTLRDAPAEVRPRIESFASRAKAFRSRLPEVKGTPGPEVWAAEKRRHLERDLVALIDAPGIEEAASDYAAKAVLAYEWEGFSEVPLKEAAYAEDFLRGHSATPLRPYLNLFIAHRYRCAAEILRTTSDEGDAQARAAARYRAYLEPALKDADPLVRFVATDMEARPYLYLERGRLPLQARKAQRPAEDTPCPDAALPEEVQDPRAWALSCFGMSAGPEATRPDSLSEFQADLYGDGKPETFIGSTVDRGNAGGTYYVFRQDGSAYRYLGSLFLHPKAFKVFGPGQDGKPRMILYYRLGAEEGLLKSVVYDGRAFLVTESEKVFPQGKDRARFCALFGLMCPQATPDPAGSTTRGPALSLRQALDIAEGYVKEEKIDLSAQYLLSVALRYDEAAKASYWHLQWMWSEPRMGGEFGLRVYLDGKVVPATLGP